MKLPFFSGYVFVLPPIQSAHEIASYYERLLSQPTDVDALARVAVFQYQLQHIPEALTHLRNLINFLKDDGDLLSDTYKLGVYAFSLFLIGRIAYESRRVEEAKEAWTNCLEAYTRLIPDDKERLKNKDVQTILRHLQDM